MFYEFLSMLKEEGCKAVYLSHYDDVAPARRLSEFLSLNGIKVTVAEDVRKFGRDFVGKVISECDMTIVINPSKDHSEIIVRMGNKVFDVVGI